MSMRIEGQLSLDGAGWRAGLESAESSLKSFIGSAVGIATVTAGFQKALEAAVEFSNEIKDGAETLGITNKAYQEFAYAAAAGGSSMELFMSAMSRLAKTQEDAKEKAGGARDALASLGVTIDDVREKTPTEIFEQIAESIQKTGINSKVTADLLEVFGKSGAKLIPMMNDLSQFKGMASLVTDNDIARVVELSNKFNALKQDLKSMATTLVAAGSQPIDFLEKFVGDHSGEVAAIEKMKDKLRRQRAERGLDTETGKPVSQSGKSAKAEEADAKAAAEIEKKIAAEKEKTRQKGLTPEEKRQEALQKIADLEKEIQDIKARGGSKASIAERQLSIAQLEGDIAGMPKEKVKGGKLNPSSDSLTSVGNFLGAGTGNTINSINQRQLEVARQQLKATQENKTAIEGVKTAVEKSSVGFPHH